MIQGIQRISTQKRCFENDTKLLKTRLLGRPIKLLTDPAKPLVIGAHSPRTTLGETLIALCGSKLKATIAVWKVGGMRQ